MHWIRKWQLTPVFLPGESQGWGTIPGPLQHLIHRKIYLVQLSYIQQRHIDHTRTKHSAMGWDTEMIDSNNSHSQVAFN